jgi:hypothetical protein
LHLHPRVDPPDGRYMLMPEGGDEGADEELPHVFVAQDGLKSRRAQGQPCQRRHAPDH